MNRRKFLTSLGALGLFNILPGAGRVWKAEKLVPVTERFISTPIDWRTFRSPYFESLPSFQDFMEGKRILAEIDIEILRKQGPTIWPPNMGDTQRIIITQ